MTQTPPASGVERSAGRSAPFQRSLRPMLICDDQRRCVDANAASCLLVRAVPDVVRRARIDDFIPEELRPELEVLWQTFLRDGDATALNAPPHDLVMPDGARVAATVTIRRFGPQRHLATIDVAAAAQAGDPHRSPFGLTKREREVLTLVAYGHTGARIAAQLFVSPTTVETHVNNALIKLEARNRVHGVAIALRAREIGIDMRPPSPARSSPAAIA